MIKNIFIGVIAVLFVFIVALAAMSHPSTKGTTNFDTLGITGLSLGSNGTVMSQILTGTMNCTGAATVAAASIGNYDCAVSNVAAGDKVFVALSTSTSPFIQAVAAYASSTAGFVRLVLSNASTTVAIAPTSATSSVSYYIVR